MDLDPGVCPGCTSNFGRMPRPGEIDALMRPFYTARRRAVGIAPLTVA